MSDPLAPKGVMGETLDRAIEVAQQALNGRRAFHYQAVFHGEGDEPTVSGEKVLADLARFCRADESTFNADPRAHALLEGRREVFLRICKFLRVDSNEVAQFVEVKDE